MSVSAGWTLPSARSNDTPGISTRSRKPLRIAGGPNHAYGTIGLITALEMPLAPAWQWIDLIVAFPTVIDAARCGYAVPLADGIAKKLLSPIARPTPDSFRQVREHCPDGDAILIAMIAEP